MSIKATIVAYAFLVHSANAAMIMPLYAKIGLELELYVANQLWHNKGDNDFQLLIEA